tara:strand:- start:778 stop:1161 length:384 start_codon:yes stop_codon:yes gene_type:complete
MKTQTETTENKTETKLNLLENIYIEDINIVDFIGCDIDIEDIKNANELYNELDNNHAFNIDIIYYNRAMKYLFENDSSLSESIEIAVDMGYSLENINSELLASLHASEKARRDFWRCKDDINEILSR